MAKCEGRAQLTGPLISYYELGRQRRRKFFLSIENGPKKRFAKYMTDEDFSEPPRRADSKNPIFIFCRCLGPGHPWGLGVRLGRILGGPSIEPFLGEGGV